MSLVALLNQVGVVEHWEDTSTLDPYGNPLRQKIDEVEEPARLQQTDATEMQVDRDTFVTNWLLFLRSGAVIRGRDRFRLNTDTYEVVGEPARVFGRREVHHIEARLVLVTG